MKILIIAHHFPPFNRIGSYRIYSFAKEWVKQGHSVTVLTTKKYTFDGDLNYIPEDEEYKKINIIEVEYGGWLTKKFNYGIEKNHEKINYSKKSSRFILTIKNVVRYLRRTIIGSSLDIHDLWISSAYEKGLELAENHKFDFMISSYSPPSSHVVASKIKQKHPSIFWIADYRDLWNGNHFDNSNWLLKKFQEYKEKKYVKYADILTTVSDPLKEYLKISFKKSVYTIENGFDIDEVNNISKIKYFEKDNVLRFVYAGTIYPKKRDPSPFFKAVKKLEKEGIVSKESLRIFFFGDSGNLDSIIKSTNVEDYVEKMGFVSKEEALRAERDCDGLLFLECENKNSNDLSARGVLTGKLFEYLVAGTQIFAVGISRDTISGQLIEVTKTGECFGDDVEAIYLQLKKIVLSGKQKLSPDYNIINKYKRDTKARELMEIIAENMGN